MVDITKCYGNVVIIIFIILRSWHPADMESTTKSRSPRYTEKSPC